MNAVIAAVKALKIDEKDIQTTNYNLAPQYNYTAEIRTNFSRIYIRAGCSGKNKGFYKDWRCFITGDNKRR